MSLGTLLFISKYDIDEKLASYPKLIKILKFYQNTSLEDIGIEAFLFIFTASEIILVNLFIIGIPFI